MENFYIKSSNYYPEVNFDVQKRVLTIAGELRSEIASAFFEPIFDWLKRYTAEIDTSIYIEAHLKKADFEKLTRWIEHYNLTNFVRLKRVE